MATSSPRVPDPGLGLLLPSQVCPIGMTMVSDKDSLMLLYVGYLIPGQTRGIRVRAQGSPTVGLKLCPVVPPEMKC